MDAVNKVEGYNNLAEMNYKFFVQSLNTILIGATSGKGRDVDEK